MKDKYLRFENRLSALNSLALLFVRLILAYGFLNPALMKWADISAIADWFQSLGMPFPVINAYLAASTEMLGVVLLTLGFVTRIISIPLIITMIVAIKTVHLENGFEAGNNGFEIPLYYILMLFVLITAGSGKYSLDYLLVKNGKQ